MSTIDPDLDKPLKPTWNNLMAGAMFDRFVIVHFISSFYTIAIIDKLFNYSDTTNFFIALFIHTLYELKDFLKTYGYINLNTNKFIKIVTGGSYNTFKNSIGDTIVCIVSCLFYIFIKTKISFSWISIIFLIILHLLSIVLLSPSALSNLKQLLGIKQNSS